MARGFGIKPQPPLKKKHENQKNLSGTVFLVSRFFCCWKHQKTWKPIIVSWSCGGLKKNAKTWKPIFVVLFGFCVFLFCHSGFANGRLDKVGFQVFFRFLLKKPENLFLVGFQVCFRFFFEKTWKPVCARCLGFAMSGPAWSGLAQLSPDRSRPDLPKPSSEQLSLAMLVACQNPGAFFYENLENGSLTKPRTFW